jgi:peptide deformylase
MAIRTILHYPDPRLRNKAQKVEAVTPAIETLVEDMAETMYAAPGVGLAATQIGEAVSIFLVDIASEDEPSDLKVFINPEIVERQGTQTWEEGCLSFPGVSEEIKRAERVKVHELDHLDGVLMIDKVGPLKKRMMARTVQKTVGSERRA